MPDHKVWRYKCELLISLRSSTMYAVPHNRERLSLTFKAPSHHEYVNICRIGVIGVGRLIPPGPYVSQTTDAFCVVGLFFFPFLIEEPFCFPSIWFALEMTVRIIVHLRSLPRPLSICQMRSVDFSCKIWTASSPCDELVLSDCLSVQLLQKILN